MFENEKVIRKTWLDYGIAYFAREFQPGEQHTFPPQIGEIGQSKNITILPTGLLRTWNENRETHLDVPGRPGRIYGGLLLPGKYTIEAIERSVYCCLAVLDDSLLKQHGVPMFELESITLNAGESVSLSYDDGYRAVISLYGQCTAERSPLKAGSKFVILGGECVVTADEYCEIAAYKLKV